MRRIFAFVRTIPLPDFFKSFGKPFRIAKLDKARIPFMRACDTPCMLDGTPVLLCARSNFPYKGDQSIGIRAIGAIEFL